MILHKSQLLRDSHVSIQVFVILIFMMIFCLLQHKMVILRSFHHHKALNHLQMLKLEKPMHFPFHLMVLSLLLVI